MFSVEGKLYEGLSKLGDLVILNILYVVCCLPIITIGAATTALYAVTKKMAGGREGYIVKTFFVQFKDNFKQSTIMWIIILAAGIILSTDLYIVGYISNETFKNLFRGFIIMAIIIVLFIFIYAMALQSTFENTIKNTLKNALMMSIGHLPWTILMTIISASPLLVALWLRRLNITEMTLMFIIWFAMIAYINSFILNHIFKRYMPEDEERKEQSEQ